MKFRLLLLFTQTKYENLLSISRTCFRSFLDILNARPCELMALALWRVKWKTFFSSYEKSLNQRVII